MRSLLPMPGGRTLPSRVVTLALGVALLATGATGCSIIEGAPSVGRVEVSVAPTTIVVGQNAQATGTAFDKDGDPIRNNRRDVVFSSRNTAVATVGGNSGVIIGVAPGTAEIVGTSDGKSASATITVLPQIPASITVVPNPVVVEVGSTVTVVPTPRNGAGIPLTGRTATFRIINEDVAQVSATGVVTGRVPGSTTLSIDIDGRRADVPVAVRAASVASIDLALTGGGTALLEGQVVQLVATLKNAAGQPISSVGRGIAYQSSDQTVAVVNGAGIVTGLRRGTTTITVIATENDTRSTIVLTVAPVPIKLIRFQDRSVREVRLGVPRVLTAVAYDSIGQVLGGQRLAYASTDPNVFTVSALGLVTPVGVGTAQLIASVGVGAAGAAPDTITVKVTEVPLRSVRVEPDAPTRYTNDTQQFTAVLTDTLGNTATGRPVRWRSSNAAVMTIDSVTGVATAVAPGSATITATVILFTGATATVSDATSVSVQVAVATITLPTAPTVAVGATTTITPTLLSGSGGTITNRRLRATSSDEAVLRATSPSRGSVSLTGVAAGTATLTVQALDEAGEPQGAPATVTVTVTP